MEVFNYCIYESSPIDEYVGYVHVSEVTEYLEWIIRKNPRLDKTFSDLWHKVLHKVYWAWTKCKYIDLDLRSPDFWVRVINDSENVHEVFVVFKADNNGTMYAVVTDFSGVDEFVYEHLCHEGGGEWKRLHVEQKEVREKAP